LPAFLLRSGAFELRLPLGLPLRWPALLARLGTFLLRLLAVPVGHTAILLRHPAVRSE
jgi:hypothetical protein